MNTKDEKVEQLILPIIEAVLKTLKAKDAEIEQWKNVCINSDETIKALRDITDKQDAELSALRKELEARDSKITAMREAGAQMQKNYAEAVKDSDELRTQLSNLVEAIDQARNSCCTVTIGLLEETQSSKTLLAKGRQ